MNTELNMVQLCNRISAFAKQYVEEAIQADCDLHVLPGCLLDQGLQAVFDFIESISPFPVNNNSTEAGLLLFRAEQILINEIASNTLPVEELQAKDIQGTMVIRD